MLKMHRNVLGIVIRYFLLRGVIQREVKLLKNGDCVNSVHPPKANPAEPGSRGAVLSARENLLGANQGQHPALVEGQATLQPVPRGRELSWLWPSVL